ncbi:MAG: hypothetical protein DRJ40_02625 [Thermoprotei archaeon]|nr:MAG: hypothetical protein DRJ40_02625 [Thermoprotei archaeon]
MNVEITIKLPEVIAKHIKNLGIDIESKIIDMIIQELNLDPEEEVKAHVELAVKFLEDGRKLINRDPAQASEKLYKAAEECVKALTIQFKLENIMRKIRERGRWTVTELEKAAEIISDRIGSWFYDAWDHAWTLHVWGFHEAKLDSEAVKRRLPYIEKIVEETKKIIRGL